MSNRPCTYDSLPGEIQELIDTSLASHLTLDQIVELVEAEGYEISRSSLDRYRRNRWLANQERIRRENQEIKTVIEALKLTPSPDVYDYIEAKLQAASAFEILEGDVDPVKRASIMLRLADMRIKNRKLDLDGEKQKLETERLELERERLELQRRKEMLPGAVKTWGLILDYFAAKEPAILTQLQAHSEPIAAKLQDYFEPTKHAEHSNEKAV